MLNQNNIRELSYLVRVDAINELPGYDRVESATVGGWRCIVPKGQFAPDSIGIYFEIDSRVDAANPAFAFMEKRNYKVKTQKMCKSISQGLLIHPSDFGWTINENSEVIDSNGNIHNVDDESKFLTSVLKVTYADDEDVKRKANVSVDKYKKMIQRNPEVFKKPINRWLMRRNWGKKLLFLFYGKKKDTRNWPIWVVKTDEERAQNMPWILTDKSEWYATEKIDGTSTTFTMKGWGRKRVYYICSRNVCFDTPEKLENGAYYDTNVYQEMSEKYNMQYILDCLMNYFENVNGEVDFVTIQAETYGAGIQKRDYSITDHDMKVFNVIIGYKNGNKVRLNPKEMTDLLNEYDIPCVPVVDEHFVLPDTVDELLEIAAGASAVDGKPREGLVFRSADGSKSFKAVDNGFIMKYHG